MNQVLFDIKEEVVMASYYNLEKTAEILKLSPAEVNRLREQGKINGVRDVTNWKFRKEDVEAYYTKMIKSRQAAEAVNEAETAGENVEDDLLSLENEHELPTMLADSASFDALLNAGMSAKDDVLVIDDPLSENDGLVLVGADIAAADNPLAVNNDVIPLSDEPEDIFAIAGEEKPVEKPVEKPAPQTAQPQAGQPLTSESGISLTGGSGSGIDLASDSMFDEDLIIGGSGSSGINLAGDSGISLLDAAADSGFSLGEAAGGSDAILELAADDDILALVDHDVDPDTATVLGAEDDFQLQADDNLFRSDDSDSSSQVIALEGELADEISAYSLAEDSDTPASVAPVPTPVKAAPAKAVSAKSTPAVPVKKAPPVPVAASVSEDDLLFSSDVEMPGVAASVGDTAAFGSSDMFSELGSEESGPFGGFGASPQTSGFGSGFDGGLSSSTAESMATTPSATTVRSGNEPQFSGGWVIFLALMVFVLSFSGSLMFELIRCMWSWSEPFAINSTILGLLGFK